MRPSSPPPPPRAVPVTLIDRSGARVDDSWTFLADEEAEEATHCAVVSLARLEAHAVALTARAGGLGVRLASDEAVERLEPFLAALKLVAIEFPKFRDGRGFTAARLLRERYGFTGEIRAIGDVLRDQLAFMARCGFDRFALKDPDPAAAAAWAFGRGAPVYQPAADDAAPVWRRRHRPGQSGRIASKD